MNRKLLAGSILGLTAAGAGYVWYRSRHKNDGLMPLKVHGFVEPGFEGVRDAFVENFARRGELGAACCVYHNGEKIVDLWGGIRDHSTMEPWEGDTMVVTYSTTKGLAAMTMALAHSRGLIDYDERVAKYWPEFAQNGKEKITVRQLLAHQAGLFAFDEPVDAEAVRDLDRLAAVMARQKPAWEPGSRHGYHAITLGFYEGELIRRVDPKHRSLGQYFHEEIAVPLGLDLFIDLPASIPNSRLAVIEPPSFLKLIMGFPLTLTIDSLDPRSNIHRALIANPGSGIVHDKDTVYARGLEVPSGGGVGTAESIAKLYGVFANGGKELGLRRETLDQLTADAVAPTNGFYDECMKGETKFLLGFMKPSEAWPFERSTAFGHPGAGGSIGFADPELGIGYAYVNNRMGVELTGDPRELALRDALYSALGSAKPVLTHRAAA